MCNGRLALVQFRWLPEHSTRLRWLVRKLLVHDWHGWLLDSAIWLRNGSCVPQRTTACTGGGYNAYGQIGNDDSTDTNLPTLSLMPVGTKAPLFHGLAWIVVCHSRCVELYAKRVKLVYESGTRAGGTPFLALSCSASSTHSVSASSTVTPTQTPTSTVTPTPTPSITYSAVRQPQEDRWHCR